MKMTKRETRHVTGGRFNPAIGVSITTDVSEDDDGRSVARISGQSIPPMEDEAYRPFDVRGYGDTEDAAIEDANRKIEIEFVKRTQEIRATDPARNAEHAQPVASGGTAECR